jgi:hypothetical protein
VATFTIFNENGPSTSATDGQALNLAHEFKTTGQTWATGIRFYRGTLSVVGPITAHITTVDTIDTGTPVVGTEVTFVLSGLGWQTAEFAEPVELNPAVRHKVVYHVPDHFTVTAGFWTADIVNGPLRAYSNANATSAQGSFSTGAITTFPSSGGNEGNYWIDVTIVDVLPPVPGSGAMSVSDQARANLLVALGLTEPQLMSNVDLMRLLLEDAGQTLVTKTSASAATHLLRYLMELRDA